MSIWNEVADLVTGGIDDIVDTLHSIPGMGEALDWGGSTFQDFANTTFGQTCLRAFVTVYGYPGLVGTLGPQLAAVSFALPGLAKGDDFDQAWCEEFMYRLEKTAEILGGDAAGKVAEQFQPAMDQLTAQAQSMGMSVDQYSKQLQAAEDQAIQQLANQAGLRADMFQEAIDYASKQVNIGVIFNKAERQALAAGLAAFGVTNIPSVTPGRLFDYTTGNVLTPAQAFADRTIQMNAVAPKIQAAADAALNQDDLLFWVRYYGAA